MDLDIRNVTKENVEGILDLRVKESQTGFIESSLECLLEAQECSYYHPVGLYLEDELIGFAMYGAFPDQLEGNRYWLDRFFIDQTFQGQGLSKICLKVLFADMKKRYDCQKIYLSVYDDNITAIHLYEKAGFQFNGEEDRNGEKVMVKVLGN